MENLTDVSLYQTETLSRLDEFRSSCLHRKSSLYLMWLCAALLLVIFSFFPVRGMQMSSLGPLLAVYYLILTVHVIYRLNTGGKRSNFLAPDIIFLGFYTLFHLGYVTLYALGLIEYAEQIIWFPTSMAKSMFIINLGLVGFLFGYELAGPKQDVIEYEPVKIPTWYWSAISFFIIAAGLLLHIMCLFMIGIDIIMAYGYVVIANIARYSSARLEILFWAANTMGVVGTIIYTVTSSLRHGKLFHSKTVLTLVIIFAAMFLLEGDRGVFIRMTMAAILIRHYFIKKIPMAFFVGFLVAAFALMTAVGVVRAVVLSPSKMVEEYKRVREAGKVDWRSPFIETGSSFRVVSIITNDVPQKEPYWKGQSFISATIRIVPFLDGITQRLRLRGPPSYGSSPAQWITYTYAGREATGMGFSVCTEGYLNFGYPGALLELLMIGFFVRWIVIKFSQHPSAAWAIIMLGFLGASFTLIRNNTLSFTSSCTQIFILAGLLSLFCRNELPMIDREVSDSNLLTTAGLA